MKGPFLDYQVSIKWRDHSLPTRCPLSGGIIPCLPGVHYVEGSFLVYQVSIKWRDHSLPTRCPLSGGIIPCLPGVQYVDGSFLVYQVSIKWRDHSLPTRCALGGGIIPCGVRQSETRHWRTQHLRPTSSVGTSRHESLRDLYKKYHLNCHSTHQHKDEKAATQVKHE